MAVQHPVAGIIGYELDVARLRYAHEHRVSRSPCRFGLAASFSPCNYELVPMQVDRMVVHTEVDQANPYAFTVPHDQRSRRRSRLTVEREPVELHVHGVGYGDIGQDGVLLENDHE